MEFKLIDNECWLDYNEYNNMEWLLELVYESQYSYTISEIEYLFSWLRATRPQHRVHKRFGTGFESINTSV